MKKDLKIGKIELKHPFLLAPLAGITDGPFRRICSDMGASLTYSEMVSGKGLWYGDKNTGKLLEILEGEGPVAYQIFGHEPEIMAYTARELSKNTNVILDINMGCPVPKIVGNGEGSALMKNPDLVFRIVEATVKNAEKPVTVKIRAGWDEKNINAVEVAKAVEAAGGAAIAVHGRTREQFYNGVADWKIIGDVKNGVSIPVIGNGDVVDVKSAAKMLNETNCDFIMIARGALGNPWIFKELSAFWSNCQDGDFGKVAENLASFSWMPEPPTKEEKKQMMIRHLQDIIEVKGEYVAVREMRKHVGWYLKGIPGAAAFRGKINQIDNEQELRHAIQKI